MKACQKYLDKHIRPTKKWKIPSKSKAGESHIVQKFPDGRYTCDCYSFMIRHKCSHIILAKKYG